MCYSVDQFVVKHILKLYPKYNELRSCLFKQPCCINPLKFDMETYVLFSLQIIKARKSVSFQTTLTAEGLL